MCNIPSSRASNFNSFIYLGRNYTRHWVFSLTTSRYFLQAQTGTEQASYSFHSLQQCSDPNTVTRLGVLTVMLTLLSMDPSQSPPLSSWELFSWPSILDPQQPQILPNTQVQCFSSSTSAPFTNLFLNIVVNDVPRIVLEVGSVDKGRTVCAEVTVPPSHSGHPGPCSPTETCPVHSLWASLFLSVLQSSVSTANVSWLPHQLQRMQKI